MRKHTAPENDYDEDDYECEDSISVKDAALAWACRGMDEDYTFGFSREELEDALYERDRWF